MDQKINAYLETLVLEVLNSPQMTNLSDEQKSEKAQKIRDHFNEVIFETLINNLSSEQLNTLKNIGLESPQAQKKIEEYSSLIPSLSTKLEAALNAEAEKIKSLQLKGEWIRQL